ncbi:hypothetical protein BJX64DRAFT_285953 [Aspergillus heterothallicus]
MNRLDGVHSITVKDFDELDRLEELGELFDSPSSTPVRDGIRLRQRPLSRAFLSDSQVERKISDTSNPSDRPHSAKLAETRTFSEDEDIYSYERSREAKEVYYQRTPDIAVVETGEALNVPTCVVMARYRPVQQMSTVFPSADVKKVSLQEGADAFTGENVFWAELSSGANARCKAVLARKLGWKPSREGE